MKEMHESVYQGAVFWPDHQGDWSEPGYFSSIAELRRRTPADELPASVLGCKPLNLELDADEIIKSACGQDGFHEDADEMLSKAGHGALVSFLDGWNKIFGREVVSWSVDEGLRVLLEPASR